MQHMETRYTHSPLDIRHYSTEELPQRIFGRENFHTRTNHADLYPQ